MFIILYIVSFFIYRYHNYITLHFFSRPLLVDLTIEEGTRLKVIYGSADGFHAVDLDTATVYDIYIPKHVSFMVPIS